MASLEHSFINDAVRTTIFNRSRRLPIIPDYSAVTDPQAQRYIQTPRVRKVLQVTVHGRVSSTPGVLFNKNGKLLFYCELINLIPLLQEKAPPRPVRHAQT